MKASRWIPTAALLLVAVLAVPCCYAEGKRKPSRTRHAFTFPRGSCSNWIDQLGMLHQRALIRNNTKQMLKLVQVVQVGLDANGSHLEAAVDTTLNLAPGKSWCYEVVFTKGAEIKSLGSLEVTGY